MTTLDLDGTKFAIAWYFDLTSPLDIIDTILDCLCFGWTVDNIFDNFFSFSSSPSKTIETGERYGPELFSSVILVYCIVRSNYCIAPFSPQST